MKPRKVLSIVAGVALAAASAVSHALVIGLAPSGQTKFAGQVAAVDVVLSGLSAAKQVVSGFDIDVNFSGGPTVFFVSGEYGPGLGVVDVDTISFAPGAAGGAVELFNSSFLSDVDLDALQGDSVVLATLRFRSNSPITSALSIAFNPATDIPGFQDPGDPNVFPTQLDPTPTNGSITWIQQNGGGVPVPAPGTLLLLVGPATWLLYRGRSTHRRRTTLALT